MFCKVDQCRYDNCHTTKGHRCGNCNKYGHGKLECNQISKMLNLQNYYNDILPSNMWC